MDERRGRAAVGDRKKYICMNPKNLKTIAGCYFGRSREGNECEELEEDSIVCDWQNRGSVLASVGKSSQP